MKQVLLLGNGISRLLHNDFIKNFDGEVWGCNFVYKERDIRLTRLTGHNDVLVKAAKYRVKHDLDYMIYTGQFGLLNYDYDFLRSFTCPGEFRKDSGTTLLAQALHEGYYVLCCGFDFGGRDIYTVRLQQRNKTNWIKRWKAIGDRYGWNNIEFIGFDHKPFVQNSLYKEKEYYKRYILGLPHIPDPEYIALFNSLYGTDEVYDMRNVERVKFQYGPNAHRPNWITEYRFDVAIKMQEKGKGKIIDNPDDDKIVKGDIPKSLSKLSKASLIKIAKIRGIKSASNKKELIEKLTELREEEAEN